MRQQPYSVSQYGAQSGATLRLTPTSVNQYFKNGIFNSPFSNNQGVTLRSMDQDTSSTLDHFAKLYRDVYEKIDKYSASETKTAYMDKLDSSFDAAIEEKAEEMADNIESFFAKYDIESPLDREAFIKTYKDVAHAVKNYHLENEPGKLNEYIEKHVNFSSNPDIKSYNAFDQVTKIMDISKKITKGIKQFQSNLASYDSNDIGSKNTLAYVEGISSRIADETALLSTLKDNLNMDEFGEKFGRAFQKAVTKHASKMTDVSEKMVRYAEYMKKLQKLQKEIKEAEAKRNMYNQKLDQANQAKDDKLVSMYLKRVAAAEAAIAPLRAELAQVEAEMARLTKEISEAEV